MKQKINKSLEQNELIFCSFFPVGLEDYENYFKKNFNNFTYLRFKFPHGRKEVSSTITKSLNNKEEYKKKILTLPTFNNKLIYFLFLPFNYLLYFLQSLMFLRKRVSKKARIFFGINYFCTLCGIVLKKIGAVDFVIYRVMDFFPIPKRGPYRFLNRIFHTIDRFCLNNSDSIWFTTEGHIIGREKYKYFDRTQKEYQIIPLAINPEKFITKPVTEENKYNIVYCGVVSRYHMLDKLFEAIEILKKDFKKINLNLIGSGPDIEYFKNLAKDKSLENNVTFWGFMEENQEFKNLMSSNLLGIALYKEEEDFMKYTEPAKVKYYLNFGLPVIISDVPTIAKELDKKGVAFLVENKAEDIANKIKLFILNQEMQKEYKNNIVEFTKNLDINKLLENNFKKTFGSKDYEI